MVVSQVVSVSRVWLNRLTASLILRQFKTDCPKQTVPSPVGEVSISCWMPKNIMMCRKYVRRSELLSPSNLRQVLNSQRGMIYM